MNDIERAKAEVFIEQTKQGLLKVVGSRLDAIKALLMPDEGAVIDCEVPTSRPPMAHALKCWPRYFDLLWAGQKHAEVRRNDRDYRIGDYLVLREYAPVRQPYVHGSREGYTGRWMVCKVSSVCDLDAVQLLEHVLLSLEFGVAGYGRRTYDHPRATGLAANDRVYQRLVGDAERWSESLFADEPRTYRTTVARSESRGDERDPKTWTRPSVIRDMLAEPYPRDPTALPDPLERRVPVSQGDGHADEPLPSFDRGPVS